MNDMIDPVTTFVVLLRGVMPTGKNKVPMAQLREILTAAGFLNVRTYIQSGNVVLQTPLPEREVEQKVHKLIQNQIGADLKIIVRTGEQLLQVLENNPFIDGHDIARVFFTLFAEPPLKQKSANLMRNDFGEEKLIIAETSAYMFIPGSAARSKLSNVMLEKKLGVAATTRNYNTLKKMIELSGEMV